jgi:hypothetical protein
MERTLENVLAGMSPERRAEVEARSQELLQQIERRRIREERKARKLLASAR